MGLRGGAGAAQGGRFLAELSAGVLSRADVGTPEGLAEGAHAVKARRPIVMTSAWQLVPGAESWDRQRLREELNAPGSVVQVLRADVRTRRYSYFRDRPEDVCAHEARAINDRLLMSFAEFERLAQGEGSGTHGGAYYMQTQIAERSGEQMRSRTSQALLQQLCDAMTQRPLQELASCLGPWVISLLYLGPPGTLTPAHYDAYDNVYLQLSGRKSFLLFDPRAGAAGLRPLPSHHRYEWRSPLDLERLSAGDMEALRGQGCEVVLSPGEALFIPSGWWHHVTALEDGVGFASSVADGLSVASLNFWFDEWSKLLVAPTLPIPAGLEAELARQVEVLYAEALGLHQVGKGVTALHAEICQDGREDCAPIEGRVEEVQNYVLLRLGQILGTTEVESFVREYLYPGRWRSVCSDSHIAPWE